MKKVYYEVGPDQIQVGPANNQILMARGKPVEFDDKTADALLKKPMFKEFAEKKSNRDGSKG